MHLVLFSEGYREEELPRFVADAGKVMEDFFAEAPFIDVPSHTVPRNGEPWFEESGTSCVQEQSHSVVKPGY